MLSVGEGDLELLGGEGKVRAANILGNPGDSGSNESLLGTARVDLTVISVGFLQVLVGELGGIGSEAPFWIDDGKSSFAGFGNGLNFNSESGGLSVEPSIPPALVVICGSVPNQAPLGSPCSRH